MTEMSMRERVARAISVVVPRPGQSAEDWMLARADAAFREMRQITDPMRAAIARYNSTLPYGVADVGGSFVAAIDAALAEKVL